ncbi:hypothetical protein [Actinomyces bowdenii]|uniref:hypothetical protein n=1 Tax=Actinomyces bowdenii TaxID=131109 RepID=UPI00312CA6D8
MEARTPGILLALMAMPMPVPRKQMPRSARPEVIMVAAGRAMLGDSGLAGSAAGIDGFIHAGVGLEVGLDGLLVVHSVVHSGRVGRDDDPQSHDSSVLVGAAPASSPGPRPTDITDAVVFLTCPT